MSRKKYIKDYRLIETVDERGRIRTDTEYIGGSFFYASGRERALRERKRLLAACAAGWLAFVGALIPNAAGLRAVYTVLPFLFSAIPLGILTDTLLGAPQREPFEHRQADRLENRLPPAALWTAILPAAALLGELVRLVIGADMNAGDGIFVLCAAVETACGAIAFVRRGGLAARGEA